VGRYEDLVRASVERLATVGWVVGPSLEAEEWRRRLRAVARERGWRLVTGIGPSGHPWAARSDLDDERATPWYRLGVRPKAFFDMYRPDAVDDP
jgi:hypothetical protein